MWHFDKRGFISVVAYDPKLDRNTKSKFPQIARQAGTLLLVRARIEADMDMLKEVVPSLLVETDPSADYSFRAVITRKQYKKFLAKSVDGITYNSHFKEAAQDASPPASGRYSAMMSVWSAMAKLQPYTPYSGTYRGDGGANSGSYSWSKPSASSFSTSSSKTPSSESRACADLDEYLELADPDAFRKGEGPRTGFSIGDTVRGYFGTGIVREVVPAANEKRSDLVRVTYLNPQNKEITATYLSNFLIPDTDDDDEGLHDLDWMLDYLHDHPQVSDFDSSLLPTLDDNAFELLTRLQEDSVNGKVSPAQINAQYDDVLWDSSSEHEKVDLAIEGAVPEKHVAEAMVLFSHHQDSPK